MFETIVREKIKTLILCTMSFVRKSFPLSDNVEKYCRSMQATDNNIPHEHSMLDI